MTSSEPSGYGLELIGFEIDATNDYISNLLSRNHLQDDANFLFLVSERATHRSLGSKCTKHVVIGAIRYIRLADTMGLGAQGGSRVALIAAAVMKSIERQLDSRVDPQAFANELALRTSSLLNALRYLARLEEDTSSYAERPSPHQRFAMNPTREEKAVLRAYNRLSIVNETNL